MFSSSLFSSKVAWMESLRFFLERFARSVRNGPWKHRRLSNRRLETRPPVIHKKKNRRNDYIDVTFISVGSRSARKDYHQHISPNNDASRICRTGRCYDGHWESAPRPAPRAGNDSSCRPYVPAPARRILSVRTRSSGRRNDSHSGWAQQARC